jgi:N-acetylglucosamine kinase-like BadF-type ATPase
MNYWIGVDGGGSKTNAMIAGMDGKIIGRGSGGSSNYHAVGIEAACASLDQALRAAFDDASLQPDAALVKMACFGLAGVDRPEDQAPLRAWADRNWPSMPVMFVSDARLVLAAGTPDGWGIGVVSGTGSIAYGRNPEGQTARAGGWGYLLGDEGSGYDIALHALRCVMRAADGRGPQTALTELILSHWALHKAQDLVSFIYRSEITKTDIAALAALVEQAATQGDSIAHTLLREAGEELALAASVVVNRLHLPSPTPCALVGGVLTRGNLLVAKLSTAARARGLEFSPIQQVTEPALGAIRLASEQV